MISTKAMTPRIIQKKMYLLWLACAAILVSPAYSQTDQASIITIRKYVQELAIAASTEQIAAQDEVKNLEASVKHLEANLKSIADKNEKVRLNSELENTKNNLSSAQSLLKNKIVASRKLRNLLSLNDAKLLAEVRKLNLMPPGQFTPSSSLNNAETLASEKAPGTPDSINPVSKNQMLKPDESFEKNNSATRNQSLSPECSFQVVGDRKKTALEPEILFTYTPEELKKHLKGIPYSKGLAFIAREPGYILLQLNMEIASEQALDYYGNLSKSFITIKLVNGKEVRLINSGFDSGKIDRFKKVSIISGIFNIDKPSEKILMSSEVDTIKLNLISGFEIYTIYNVDFFTRQLSCINSLK